MTSLPLSALQHCLFCARQCALIHVERLWSENVATAEGRVLHERADGGHPESRNGARVLRAVQLASEEHGLHGVADVVEMRGETPYPVEYKRGRPKAHRADEVQLCAQALCLEEMTGAAVPEGALFYGKTRRRKVVEARNIIRDLRDSREEIALFIRVGETSKAVAMLRGHVQGYSDLLDSTRALTDEIVRVGSNP